MVENKVSLLMDATSDCNVSYQKIGEPKKPNKCLQIFGSYLALPLISLILIIALLVLFFILKIYFTNSYMYAIQDNLSNKKELDVGGVVDTRYNLFKIFKKDPNSLNNNNNENNNTNNILENGNYSNNNKTPTILDAIKKRS